MLYDQLLHIGLAAEEIKVYLTVLELGGGFVSTIARKAGVHRVTCYNTLGNLEKKGLIRSTLQKNVRFYTTEPPRVLINQIEEKYIRAQKLLPELEALYRASAFTPRIQFFEDRKNIIPLFEQMTAADSEILGYTNLAPLSELFGDTLRHFGEKLISEKKKCRLLCPYDVDNTELVEQYFSHAVQKNHLEVLCVNPEQFPFKNGVFFYDDKMAIISYDKNELLGVIIQSSVNTQTQKAMFDLAWLGATSFIVR